MMLIFFLFLFNILGQISNAKSFQKRESTNNEQAQLPLQSGSSYSAAASSQNLRIYIDYTADFNSLTDVQFYKDNVITPAVTYWQKTLSAKNPSSTPILVDRDCVSDSIFVNNDPTKKACTAGCAATTTCSNITIPTVYLKKCYQQTTANNYQYVGTDGAGISGVDIVIITTSTVCPGTMLASALSCFQEPSLDRPILGVMNICQQTWNPRFNIASNLNTVKHELVHAFGFASDRFAFFRDQNGNPYTTRDAANQPNLGYSSVGSFFNFAASVAKVVTRTRSSLQASSYTKQIYALTLPTLLAEARSYFGCPTLDGVDLQDSGPGTVNTHFNKLLVNNELMSPNADAGEGLTSRFTLSFLQDTGWYTVDFTQAQNFTFGKGMGCDFILNGCYHFLQKQMASGASVSPFCNTIPNGYAMKCSDDRRYTYSCHLYKNIGLDPKYTYFNQLASLPAGDVATSYAGDNAYNEYCPVNFKDTYNKFTSDCNVVNNNLRTDTDYVQFNDYYNTDSKCFDTTSTVWSVSSPTMSYQPTYYGAKCFQYKCDTTAETLYVYFAGQTICRTTTQQIVNQIKSNYLTFSINCPTYSNVCVVPTATIATPSIPNLITTPRSYANMNKKSYTFCISIAFILWLAIIKE